MVLGLFNFVFLQHDFQDGGFESARRGLLPGGIHDEALSPVSKERNHNDALTG